MNDCESKELTRSNYVAQMAMLGYEPNGNPKDMVEIVRCKDCIYRGDATKCIVANLAEKTCFPVFVYDNRGEWYCADGRRR